MKKTLSSLILLLAMNFSFAQKNYDDLRILYADGSYEKLAKVADKYTQDDDTKKDALPYIWLARALYKIHNTGNANEAFKNAYKESINAMNKFLKFDKDKSLIAEDENKDFLIQLQNSLIEQIENEITTGNFRKVAGWVSSYKKITLNEVGQQLLEGAIKFRTDDKSTAMSIWKVNEPKLNAMQSMDQFTEADKRIMMLGVIQTAECYVAMRKVDNAKMLLNKIKSWFEDEEMFQEAYKKIVG